MLLHATIAGDGPPVCLLHGLFGRAQNLGALARVLAPNFRVVTLDLRNHGASPHAGGMSYAAMVDDVMETLALHDALPVRLLGHSMGGKVAMVAALTRPGMVARLVVADIAPVAYHHHNARIARALRDLPLVPGLTRRAADAALSASIPDPGIRGFLLQNLVFGDSPAWRIGLDEIAAGIADVEDWPALPDAVPYRGPTMFICGALSDYVTESHWPAVTALFPKAEKVRLEGAGHWLHADRAEAFGEAVVTFLRGETEGTENFAAIPDHPR